MPIGEADRERVVTDEGDLFCKEICGHGRWVVHSASCELIYAVSAGTEGPELNRAEDRLYAIRPFDREEGGAQAFAEAGIDLRPLMLKSDVAGE